MDGLKGDSEPEVNKQKEKRKADDSEALVEETLDGTASAKRVRSEHAGEAPSKPSGLPALLDCSSLKDEAEISDRFHLIARSLLCEHVLVVKPPGASATELEYELLEVEFYLLSAGNHEDPFTHGTEEQRVSGKWYFHKSPTWLINKTSATSSSSSAGDSSAGGYRGGTRKGLDLTMGGALQASSSPHFPQAATVTESSSSTSSSKKAGPRGGVLFRSMRRVGGTGLLMSARPVISGPSLLVDEVLRACGGVGSVLELVEGKLGGDTNAIPTMRKSRKEEVDGVDCVQLYLRPRSKRVETSIHTSPRIGLELSNPVTKASFTDPRVVFVQKPYRFFTHPTLLTASGRAQTFLGVYLSTSSSSQRSESQLRAEVARITGLKRPAVDKYAEEYKRGKEAGKLKEFVGAAGKGVSSKPAQYLKMLGTLAAAKQ